VIVILGDGSEGISNQPINDPMDCFAGDKASGGKKHKMREVATNEHWK